MKYTWFNWQNILDRKRFIADSEKVVWVESILFLKEELGRGFLNNCGTDHPILKKLIEIEPVKDFIDLVDALRKLKQTNFPSYESLLKKIKPRIKCQTEGMPFWEILRTYSREGFEVHFLEPIL